MKQNNFFLKLQGKFLFVIMLLLGTVTANSQVVFGWETATVSGFSTIETISGVTLTLSSSVVQQIGPGGGLAGTSGNVVVSTSIGATNINFAFSQAVNVNSIIVVDALGEGGVVTFTPIGGSNSPVNVTINNGITANVNTMLNWVGVTSFSAVYSNTNSVLAFDTLNVTIIPLALNENIAQRNQIVVYPNPTIDILNINSDKKVTEITITNVLGQTILIQKPNAFSPTINVSSLTPNTYFAKITADGITETVKIIKQ